MATIDFNKENLGPLRPGDVFGDAHGSPSTKKDSRKGRSKSIGPGALDEIENVEGDSRDRRKSAFLPATKSILSRNEDAQKAARRKTMGNRRVSFAPEATLHTWDVIELGRDQTTSTDSSEATRRNSQFTHSSTPNSDGEEQASSPSGDDEGITAQSRISRRSSEIPAMNVNRSDNLDSSSIASDESGSEGGELAESDIGNSSDEEGAEGTDEENDEEDSEDDEGTAMSLDTDDATVRSVAMSEESTGSSARLEASLRQAAQTAGTRGIEYDEYGDMSMEMVNDEITNAFKPWAQKVSGDDLGSAAVDQENINPFPHSYKTQPPHTHKIVSEGDDATMDITRAIGGIMKNGQTDPVSSPFSDATMEMTQAVGKITMPKRRYSTAETGSPGVEVSDPRSKRRRSSAARSSMGDDSMELTMVAGGIHTTDSPVQKRQTRSMGKRRSSGFISETGEPTGTMEFTRAIGGIKPLAASEEDDGILFDGNEELSMEFTTALGSIRPNDQVARAHSASPHQSPNDQPQRIAATSPRSKPRQQPHGNPDQDSKSSPAQTSRSMSSTRRSPRKSQRSSSPIKAASPTAKRPSSADDIAQEVEEKKPADQSSASPDGPVITYPDLSSLRDTTEHIGTPQRSPSQHTSYRTPESESKTPTKTESRHQQQSPTVQKPQHSTPTPSTMTPERSDPPDDTRTLANSIKLLSTPRKETLKHVSPLKRTPVKPTTPMQTTPRGRRTPKGRSEANEVSARKLNEDLATLQSNGQTVKKVGLQEFLTTAGIRFMDLTTTKRRVTAAPTPSKAGQSQDADNDEIPEEDMTLESGIVAAACTAPELDLYRHACHELKRYTKEGKQMVAELEAETAIENPPLVQAYVNAATEYRNELDTQMRDMKTNARFRSKELWYSWRRKLLDELMMGLGKIGEGLIQDDDLLGKAEAELDEALPELVKQRDRLQEEAQRLERTAVKMTDAEKVEVQSVREDLRTANSELEAKRRILEKLRQEVQEQDRLATELRETKEEFTAAIQEAHRVREACRGISSSEVAALRDSVKHLEDTFGWTITSASAASSAAVTVTMTYKSQLELTFQPAAFGQPSGGHRPNAPISLSYVAVDTRTQGAATKPLTTTLRFFLQLLQAALQGLSQSTTRTADLLALVGEGWETALAVAETERRLSLETRTEAHIRDDSDNDDDDDDDNRKFHHSRRLDIRAVVMLPRVRTKVHVTFMLRAWVSQQERRPSTGRRSGNLRVQTAVEPDVTVVYGEQYHEKNMTEFMRGHITGETDGDGDDDNDQVQDWDCALQEIRAKLVARGVKGVRK